MTPGDSRGTWCPESGEQSARCAGRSDFDAVSARPRLECGMGFLPGSSSTAPSSLWKGCRLRDSGLNATRLRPQADTTIGAGGETTRAGCPSPTCARTLKPVNVRFGPAVAEGGPRGRGVHSAIRLTNTGWLTPTPPAYAIWAPRQPPMVRAARRGSHPWCGQHARRGKPYPVRPPASAREYEAAFSARATTLPAACTSPARRTPGSSVSAHSGTPERPWESRQARRHLPASRPPRRSRYGAGGRGSPPSATSR